MLNKVIEFSIKRKLIIGLFVLGLIGVGSYQLTRLPIDAVPDITDNQVQIITTAPSFGATDIERLVTFPIEQANINIQGIKELRSFSRFGLSLVTIVFEEDVDVYWARQQVSERLQTIKSQIPAGIGESELGPITTGLGEIYQYVVRPEKGYENQYDPTELRTIQDWIIRRQLLNVKGVAEVSSFGGKLKQYSVEVNPARLQSFSLTIQDVFEALENNNQNTGGAYIEKGPTVLYIRTEGLISNLEDIANIAIKRDGPNTVFVRDVAEVKTGNAIRYGALTYNGEGEVAGAIVMMLKGANSNQVIKDVKDRIEQIRKTLPEGVTIEPFLDRTKMVNSAISTVKTNLLEGALIVLFVLVLFLGNVRSGLLVASVIPLSMLFAVCMMNLFGVSGNLMSLGALDFGLIVDGAVIIVEAVLFSLALKYRSGSHDTLSTQEMDQEVQKSAGKMMNSAVFGQIIILIVYLPILTLKGIEGKMFKPMAQTVFFALVGAFILSLTYIPMMSALVLKKSAGKKENISERTIKKLGLKLEWILRRLLHYPKTVIASALLLFGIALFVLSRMGGEFIPTLEEGDFAVDTRVLTGSNLNTTIEYVTKAAHILKTRFPEVEKVVTKIGSGEVPTDPMSMEESDMMVILKPKKEWTSARTFNDLADRMTEALDEVPGITLSFQYPVQMRFNELMTGARQDVVCKIFGEDLDTLTAYAQKLASIAQGVKGAKDIYVEPVTGVPQVVIEYDRPAVAQYGIDIAGVNRIVNAALAGQVAGTVYEGERFFDLVVRVGAEDKQQLEDIQGLLIPLPNGGQIPLRQIARVDIEDGPNQIQREDARRRIIVGFNVGDRDVQSIVHELQEKVEKQIDFPAGYYATYGGAFENLNEALERLTIAVPLALLLIFILLYFTFHSVRQGLLIYSAIPLSAIGGIFSLSLRGMPFSISAGVGFIALFGIAVLNGIVLISEFNRLKKEGVSDLREIVIRGSKTRLRPVLITAAVASLGFLPMALSQGAGAEVQRPLATVVIGGLTVATILTLFVLPVLYSLFEKRSFDKMKKKRAMATAMLVLGLLTFGVGHAQTPISLDAAKDSAIKNNRMLTGKRMQEQRAGVMRNTAADIPHTTLEGSYGQIASIYNDNEIGIGQTIRFPGVYRRQRTLLLEQFNAATLDRQLTEAEIGREVAHQFFTILFLEEKRNILLQADSIYTEFLERSGLRLELGETNVLENITATNMKGQIRLQLDELARDMEIAVRQFNFLLHAEEQFIPTGTLFALRFDQAQVPDPADLPWLRSVEQQQRIAAAETEVQRSKLLPEIGLKYQNSSMQGVGADDKYYGSSKRFHSVSAHLGIPLFRGAQKAQIQAARIQESIATQHYEAEIEAVRIQRQNLLLKNRQLSERVAWYQNTGRKGAEDMYRTAARQFQNGEINYLEWAMLMNQALEMESSYVEAVRDLNENIINLTYFFNQ